MKGAPKAMKRAKAATATMQGPMKQAAFQANSAAAPTQAEFNALLTKLKTAGIMASS